jgi:hypothetical protein
MDHAASTCDSIMIAYNGYVPTDFLTSARVSAFFPKPMLLTANFPNPASLLCTCLYLIHLLYRRLIEAALPASTPHTLAVQP